MSNFIDSSKARIDTKANALRAVNDYARLEVVFGDMKRNASIESLRDFFGGWHLEDDGTYFDFDFGCLTLTIHKREHGFELGTCGIEVFDLDEEPCGYIDDINFLNEYLSKQTEEEK